MWIQIRRPNTEPDPDPHRSRLEPLFLTLLAVALRFKAHYSLEVFFLGDPFNDEKKKPLKFSFFRTYFSWRTEFKTVGILAMSLPVPKIFKMFVFGFLTVHAYLKRYFYEIYSV